MRTQNSKIKLLLLLIIFSWSKSNAQIKAPETTITIIPSFQHLSNANIFPDPAKDFLIIEGILGKTNVKMYNVSGKLVLEKQAENYANLNIEQLHEGLYFLVLSNNKGWSCKKILIVK